MDKARSFMDQRQVKQGSGRVLTRRRPTRPPRSRHFSAIPTGPRMYRNDDRRNATYELFFSPPPAFLTFTNSRSEWVIYVALSKVLGVPKDPRQGPYIGWPGVWSYQSPFEGGRAARGGQVIDFIVHGSTTASGDIALRIQTERYHQFTDDSKHAKDEQLKLRVARMGRIVDLFEQDFMNDPSGQAACINVKQAIFGGSARNPLRSGTARRIRT